MTDQFANLALPIITSSLTNPRQNFDPAKLAELAESIKASGVHQPILVRPLPGSRVADTERGVQYELVCGERRLRASQLAGVPTIPAMVRALTDDQVLEIQIIENLQRDDLTELEEAEGYAALMQHNSINADQVGEKIGKSRSYVYGRLKLLDLSTECKQAMREGKIDASRALLIARIPDGKLQIKALTFATTSQGYPAEPPSVRRLQDWLKANVMLKLEQAVFKLTDTRLVEGAGSCAECPKRTGANPDLFTDVDSADICTDPACFHGKEEAHRAQLVKKAEAKGMRIVQDKEALELLGGNQWRDKPNGYTELSTQRLDLSTDGERPVTLGQALGNDAPSPILFIHPKTQEVSELVPIEEAEAVLLAKGLIKVEEHRAEKLEDLGEHLTRLQERAKQDTERESITAIHTATADAIRATNAAQAKRLLTGEVLRAYLLSELDNLGPDDVAEALGYKFAEGDDEENAITAHIQRMGDTDLLRAVALMFLDRDRSLYGGTNTARPVLDAFVKDLEVDTKAARRKAAATVKANHAEKIREIQAQIDAQKAPPANAPAARQEVGAGGSKGGTKGKGPAPKKSPPRVAKLSAEDATLGIAVAMQGLEGTASANAVAPSAEPAGVLVVGARVKALAGKLKGKEGEVVKALGDDYFNIKFKGRSVASTMNADQVELVQAVAA